MKSDATVVSFDFQELLGEVTGTKPHLWREVNGPDSGCGCDYFYTGPGGRNAYINVDQTAIVVEVDGDVLLDADYQEDELVRRYVRMD